VADPVKVEVVPTQTVSVPVIVGKETVTVTVLVQPLAFL
jgi:hypothetical protein